MENLRDIDDNDNDTNIQDNYANENSIKICNDAGIELFSQLWQAY